MNPSLNRFMINKSGSWRYTCESWKIFVSSIWVATREYELSSLSLGGMGVFLLLKGGNKEC